jgi:hypothetical protein
MSTTSWRPLRALDRARFGAARLQAHHAVQWLARGARAYVVPQPDDGHTNLGWDDAFGGLVTHPSPHGGRLGLRLADLTLAPVGPDGTLADTFALAGRRDADVRDWLGRRASAHGLDPAKLDAPLPYGLPQRPGDTYLVDAEQLGELATWFSNANSALGGVREQIAARKLGAPPVRCWPHHFDLDTLVTVAPGRTSGVGFEPGDDYYDEPYFYVSLYPAPDIATLPPLPSIGHWHSHHFTAAVATASAIAAASDPQAAVEDYLRAAVDAVLTTFGR